MKRPLACFSISFMVSCIAAALLPVGFILPLGIVLAAVSIIFFCVSVRHFSTFALFLFFAASAAAFVCFAFYNKIFVQPVQQLDGTTQAVLARVVDVDTSYYSAGQNFCTMRLQVLSLENESVKNFYVSVFSPSQYELGDIIKTELKFSSPAATFSSYSKSHGEYISPSIIGNIEQVSHSPTVFTAAKSFQYRISENIRSSLPAREGSVAAAMAIGDKSFLPPDIITAYRKTGISHILVVSGLHTVIICGSFYKLISKIFGKKRLSSLASIFFTLAFMFICGLGFSVLRSGTMLIMVFTANLFKRKSDSYTSMGFAGLIICLLNPYAAIDAGFLLSFSATLAAIYSPAFSNKIIAKLKIKKSFRLYSVLIILVNTFCTSTLISIATLPILIAFDMGVSLLSIPANMLILPVIPFVVIVCLLSSLASFSMLNFLFQPMAYLAYGFIHALNGFAIFISNYSIFYLYIGGIIAFSVCISVYFLIFIGMREKLLRLNIIFSCLILFFSIAISSTLNRDVLTISCAGYSDNYSVIASIDGKSIVLYRNRNDYRVVYEKMMQLNATECIALIDMRSTIESAEYSYYFTPDEIINVNHDIFLAKKLSYFEEYGISIYIRQQANGHIIFIEANGITVAIPYGKINIEPYLPIDCILLGYSNIEGYSQSQLLYYSQLPAFAENIENIQQASEIKIRPGKSFVIK